jgi:hypothetical protein
MIKVRREFLQRIAREKVKLEEVSVNVRMILKLILKGNVGSCDWINLFVIINN